MMEIKKKRLSNIRALGFLVCLITFTISCNKSRQDSTGKAVSQGEPTAIEVPEQIPKDAKWSERMALSVIKRTPRLEREWGYHQGFILFTFEKLADKLGKQKYFDYVRDYTDDIVGEDGTIKTYEPTEFNIDNINGGKMLFKVFEETGNEKYHKAIENLREQLRWQPETTNGGFWHKLRYPWQMWLDGAYMGSPFLAQYALNFGNDSDFDKVAHQIILMDQKLRDPETGLLYHGWDESGLQIWSDPETGRSSNFWGRGMGWYGMAIVDLLDYFPQDHPQRPELIDILRRLVAAWDRFQDPETGLWYQVVDQGNREENYLEASASNMYVYTMAKGVRKGYLDEKYLETAKKGYEGILDRFIEVDENDGEVHLNSICEVAGLGPNRDGSFEYYMSEPVVSDDIKGVAPFILASIELDR